MKERKNMNKPLIIFIFIAALILALALLGQNKDFTSEELNGFVEQSREISRFAGSPKPDFKLLADSYENGPRKFVKWVDAKNDIEMDDKILDSIELGAEGSIPQINALIIDLTIKRVFMEYIRHEIGLEDGGDRITVAAKALRPYVKQAEKWAGKTGVVTGKLNSVTDGQEILKIYRSCMIACFFSELDNIEGLRESNKSMALYHTAKAMQFLHMIYQDISVKNRADAVYIYGEFSKNSRAMELDEVRNKMKESFGEVSEDFKAIFEIH